MVSLFSKKGNIMAIILNIDENTAFAKIFPYVLTLDFAVCKRSGILTEGSSGWTDFVKFFSHDCWHRGGFTKAQWDNLGGGL
jgi:hypothetical protein